MANLKFVDMTQEYNDKLKNNQYINSMKKRIDMLREEKQIEAEEYLKF